MKNLRMYLPLVDGGQYPLEFTTGKELIEELISDDWGAPPRFLVIESSTGDGKQVRIAIPFDQSSAASATIE